VRWSFTFPATTVNDHCQNQNAHRRKRREPHRNHDQIKFHAMRISKSAWKECRFYKADPFIEPVRIERDFFERQWRGDEGKS
jgi:hypothetical protein